MSRWLAVFLLMATGLAAQQPPSAPMDSGAVARGASPCLRASGAPGLSAREARRGLSALQEARRGRDPGVCAVAARGVGEIADSSSIAALGKLLADGAIPVREAAAWALGES